MRFARISTSVVKSIRHICRDIDALSTLILSDKCSSFSPHKRWKVKDLFSDNYFHEPVTLEVCKSARDRITSLFGDNSVNDRPGNKREVDLND